MYVRRVVYGILCVTALVALGWRPNLAADAQAASARPAASAAEGEQHYLYVALPGIRNYIEYGGVGVLVYDMSNGHRLVKRIPTFDPASGEGKENVKGIAADAAAGRLYVATIKRVVAIDVGSERIVWNRTYDGGADRLAISPDGTLLYVPSLEGPHWHAVDAKHGDVVATVITNTAAHNTIYGGDGREVYLAGLGSPNLLIADPRTHTVVRSVGPFSNMVRPFTVNGAQTLCFVNVNELLGFEVGDLKTGKMLHRVEVAGYEKGRIKRHGCPSHGVGLTPDETELWLADAANSSMHVFDATVMPPKQLSSIKLRDQPGWITFSLDGRYAYPSTGEVIDTASKQIVATLSDETGRAVQSEKVVEIVFKDGKPVRAGDQFGVGRRPAPQRTKEPRLAVIAAR